MDREKVTCFEMVHKLTEISKVADEVMVFCRNIAGATNVERDFVRALNTKKRELDIHLEDLMLDLAFRARRETLDEIEAGLEKKDG